MRIGPNNQADWGERAQIGGTVKELQDLEGNRDTIWDNEDKVAGTTANAVTRSSLAVKIGAANATGWSTGDEVERLKGFVTRCEREWGQPVVDRKVKAKLKNPELFASQKAIALTRLGRKPDSVVDGFVRAAGSVDGQRIAPRQVFYQHFKPTAAPTGNVIVVAPGYLETGRNFYKQIEAWNAAGHDVVVMDQQWAGQTQGIPGRVDRGFGIMRDVAAVTAQAAALAKQQYGDQAQVAMFGNSMGGLGVVGAYFMNLNGKVQLDGPQMPKDVRVAGMAVYFEPTPSVRNKLTEAASPIPVLNNVALPAIEGLPELTSDPVAEHLVAQGSTLEDVRAQLSTFANVEADVATLREVIRTGARPERAITLVHGDHDPLANPTTPAWLRDTLGANLVDVRMVGSNDHVLEQSPSQWRYGVDAVNDLLRD